jgi:hypothetical protein
MKDRWEPKRQIATYLNTHIDVGSTVEVVVGPFGKGVLTELLCGTVVLERELRVGLEELRLLHLLGFN